MPQRNGLPGPEVLLAAGCLVFAVAPLSAGESPWYAEALFGRAEAEAGFGSRHPKSIDDRSETAAIALGYTVHRFLSIQAGYHDLGSHRGHGSPCRQTDDSCIERLAGLGLCVEGFECTEILVAVDADVTGFSVAAVPRWPLGDRVAVRGKVGLMFWDSEISGPPSFGRIEDFSGEDLLVAIGLTYDLPSGLGVVLEHEELDLDVGSTVLGVTWRF